MKFPARRVQLLSSWRLLFHNGRFETSETLRDSSTNDSNHLKIIFFEETRIKHVSLSQAVTRFYPTLLFRCIKCHYLLIILKVIIFIYWRRRLTRMSRPSFASYAVFPSIVNRSLPMPCFCSPLPDESKQAINQHIKWTGDRWVDRKNNTRACRSMMAPCARGAKPSASYLGKRE